MKNEIKIYLAAPRGFCAGVDRAIEIVKKALDKSKGFIRTMLGKSISLKKIPTISFFKDDI